MALKARQELSGLLKSRQFNAGVAVSDDGRVYPIPGNLQAITSQGHAYRKLGATKGNIGGPFTSQKVSIKLQGDCSPTWLKMPALGPAPYDWAQEYFTIPVPSAEVRSLLTSVNLAGNAQQSTLQYLGQNCGLGFGVFEMIGLGAKAVDMMAPLSPVADTATTLAEFISERKLFNVPGSDTYKSGPDSLPGEYLNLQFGVLPTVGFAKDLRKAIVEREETVRQVARDSGRRVRRSGEVFSEKNIEEINSSSVYPSAYGPLPVTGCFQRGILRKTTTTTRRAWFSGAFTYYLPEEGIMRTVAELDALYGVLPGMDTAWELLPFSWLADYKTTMGAAIGNFNRFAQDGVVMNYGYIMGEKIIRDEYHWSGSIRIDGNFRPVNLRVNVEKTTKQRVQANPFGFGVLPGDLSDRQWSILAALGLSYLT